MICVGFRLMNKKVQHEIARKLQVLNHAEVSLNVGKPCRYFGISSETFYQWKRAYLVLSKAESVNQKPCPENSKCRPAKPH